MTNTDTLTAMVVAAGNAPSTSERGAMNALAGTLASNELREAAHEWKVASKAHWTSMLKNVPSKNKAARPAHRILCTADSAAWRYCMHLMENQGLKILPAWREFLTYLTEL